MKYGSHGKLPRVSDRLKTLVIAVAGLLALSVPAAGQERMVLGPRQFEFDKTGNGAVLCAWSMYLSVQAKTAACGLQRRPTDDAMDEAIAAIDQFILANSSLHPTRPMLEEFKRSAAESDLAVARKQGLEKACTSRDLEHFRSISPDQIRGSVKKLLEAPREPVINPCL
ncbi:hypothetical protein [Bradyrhizobium roseum]|uniref:hypothetical protein n=1 Tax=Bradyrhizobium roseum TaxID=3056648 RepID=UPI002631A081|nr:hypothetical protein [Bradyrhizobium roseus]WKA29433.1 hypothetical protein QUH67_04350 [Bradyrhizobium roseus]